MLLNDLKKENFQAGNFDEIVKIRHLKINLSGKTDELTPFTNIGFEAGEVKKCGYIEF